LERDGRALRLYNTRTDRWLLTPKERAAEAEVRVAREQATRRAAEYEANRECAARHAAEARIEQEETARRAAEARIEQEETARRAAEAKALEEGAVRRAIEAELERVRRELELLRRQPPPTQS
jgi:hypothetical protein